MNNEAAEINDNQYNAGSKADCFLYTFAYNTKNILQIQNLQ